MHKHAFDRQVVFIRQVVWKGCWSVWKGEVAVVELWNVSGTSRLKSALVCVVERGAGEMTDKDWERVDLGRMHGEDV